MKAGSKVFVGEGTSFVAAGRETALFHKVLNAALPGVVGRVFSGSWFPSAGIFRFDIEDLSRQRRLLWLGGGAPGENRGSRVIFEPALRGFPAEKAAGRLRPGFLAALGKIFGAAGAAKLKVSGECARQQADHLVGEAPGAWRKFFAPEKLGDYLYTMFLDLPVMHVYHADFECYSGQFVNDGVFSYFNSPWCADAPLDADNRREMACAVTDLGREDFIFGASRKLAETLAALAPVAPAYLAAVVHTSCSATVTGDDGRTVCRALQRGYPVPLFFETVENADWLRTLSASLLGEGKPARGKSFGINLMGFPRTRGLAEFLSDLKGFGLEINSVALPRMSRGDVARYAGARLQVVTAGTPYAGACRKIARKAAIKSVELRGPYGVGHTREWLRRVLDEAGGGARFEALWEKYYGAFAGRLEGLKERCAGHTLGFVGDAAGLKALARDGYAGFPVLDVVKELGFSVVYFSYRDAAREADGVRVVPFATERELSRLLAGPAVSAVFSDFFFDVRLSRNGKNQFSLKEFDVGLPGLLRTAGALLASCECRFYKRYGRFLK